jgi:hypothetical protein
LCLKPSASSEIGYTFFSFSNDNPIECLDHIRACLGLPAFAAGTNPQRATSAPAGPPDNSLAAKKLWLESTTIRGSLAERYLFEARGLRLASDLDWSRVLRFHPSRILVALMRDALTDEPRAAHRTYLDAAGKKISRKMLGPTKGAVVKVDRLGTSTTLAIGEGLESTLSGRAMGFFPAWSVGSAGAIGTFPVIPGVRHLYVFTEADDASEKAFQQCRGRWHEAGCKVSAVRPAEGCKDLNDEWRLPTNAKDFLETCQRFWPGAVLSGAASPCRE